MANPTVLEVLLRERADDERSTVDQVHLDRVCHVLRAHCGEHGARLATTLLRKVAADGAAPSAAVASEDDGQLEALREANEALARERDKLQTELGQARSQLQHLQATRGQVHSRPEEERPVTLAELGLAAPTQSEGDATK